jgi:hypothetical protein
LGSLEQKIYEYFYYGDIELRLLHLTAIRQNHNEHILDYIRRFRDTRNQYFNLNVSDKDLVTLAYSGLSPHLKKIRVMSFPMLAKSCKGLWIVKVEPRSLEATLGAVISLGTSDMLIWSSIVVSHRMTRKPTCT